MMKWLATQKWFMDKSLRWAMFRYSLIISVGWVVGMVLESVIPFEAVIPW